MEILVSIEKYLAGDMPYSEAILLYDQIGNNGALKKLFATGEDDYSVSKLHSEFKNILAGLQSNSSQNSFKTFATPKNNGTLQVELFPEKLRIEYAKLRPIIAELSNLNAKLELYPTNEERFEAAAKIYILAKKRRAIWDRVDYFKEHGADHPMYQDEITEEYIPEKQKVTLFEAKYKLGLLRSQRTKLTGKQHRYNDLVAIHAEIEELEELIANG